ncbi:MAG: hypothetical protein V9F06_13450 [Thermomicrobiales bacterium]
MSEPAAEQPDRQTPAGLRRGREQPSAESRVTGANDEQSDAREASEIDAGQSGVDARRRGWFWHWNTIVTQYSPLIGLKGIGLLNSYTVWTDRREESPRRGYAFPSQQAEADFYGEDRAELITINKILVALDLIEIRKEMILRIDERGRRWRVPHNLYRVKDHGEHVTLRAMDVIAVANVAARDDAVYRYVRRVFSPRFDPIDRDNVWHEILTEVAGDPLWQALRERTRELEERASARSRAGHRKRADTKTKTVSETTGLTSGQEHHDVLPSTQQSTLEHGTTATSVVQSNDGQMGHAVVVVDNTNNGSSSNVGQSNNGLSMLDPTTVDRATNGLPTAVAPGNTTYHQHQITTTTTTTTPRAGDPPGLRASPLVDPVGDQADDASVIRDSSGSRVGAEDDDQEGLAVGGTGSARKTHIGDGDPAEAQRGFSSDGDPGGGKGVGSSPAERGLDRADDKRASGPLVDPGPLVVSIFEAANDRRATPLERILLGELERDADPPARAAGSTGGDWVVAALREAVASGSAFVAPKRIREIVQRWAADREGPRGAGNPGVPALAGASGIADQSRSTTSPPSDVRLPGGARGSRTWAIVLDDLAAALSPDTFNLLLDGSAVRRYWRGTVEIEIGSQLAADKLSTEYRSLVERLLNARLSQPVIVSFHVAEPDVASMPPSLPPDETKLAVSRADVDLGRQVWHAVLADLSAGLAAGDAERLSGVVPLGQDAGGLMLLASPSPVARRLLDGRYRSEVERSLSTILGSAVRIRLVGRDEWSVSDDPGAISA